MSSEDFFREIAAENNKRRSFMQKVGHKVSTKLDDMMVNSAIKDYEKKRKSKVMPNKSKSSSGFQTRGKQQLLENQTTRTTRSGAALLKSIKRRMLKGIPGTKNKSY